MLPSQKLAFFLKDMELPYLEGFESRLDSYYESRKNTKDTSHGKMFCFAPASCFCEIVEERIRKSLDLSGKDLLSPIVVHREGEEDQELPSVQSLWIIGFLLSMR